jgi:hypothetical protein
VDKDSIYEFVIHVVLNFIYLMFLNLRNKRQSLKKKDEREEGWFVTFQ